MTGKRYAIVLGALLCVLLVACAARPLGSGVPEPEVATPAGGTASVPTAPPTAAEQEAPPAIPATTESLADDERVTLHVAIGGDPPTLDPALAIDERSLRVLLQMFVGLTQQDAQGNVVPALATGWDVSEEGRVYTFHLRNDVPWVRVNPGTGAVEAVRPVTAHDVAYGVKRVLNPELGAPLAYSLHVIEGAEAFHTADPSAEEFGALEAALGVRALDDTTVEFRLTAPISYFPAIASSVIMFSQPRDATLEAGERWTDIGTFMTNGPYALAEWTHETSILLEKNPHWIDAEGVQIERVEIDIVPQESTRLALYETDEIDTVEVPAAEVGRIRRDPELNAQLITRYEPCTEYVGFVTTKAPVDDPLVRRALSAAIDRRSVIEHVLEGQDRPAHSFGPPQLFGSVVDDMAVGDVLLMDDYQAQLAQAQAWMAEAGYPAGEGLALQGLYNTNENVARVMEAIQGMWQAAFPQMTLSLGTMEWGVYLETLAPESPPSEKPHFFRLGWCADYMDQNNFLNDVFHSGSANNFALYDSAAFDALVEQAASDEDPQVRRDLYRAAEQLLVEDDAAIAPLLHPQSFTLLKPWILDSGGASGFSRFAEWQIDWEAKQAARSE